MSRLLLVLLAAGIAGCAAQPENEPQETGDLRLRQERACAAATAEHIGRGMEAVTSTWRGSTEDGRATVDVRDGDRLHVCEIDASSRSLSLVHPGA